MPCILLCVYGVVLCDDMLCVSKTHMTTGHHLNLGYNRCACVFLTAAAMWVCVWRLQRFFPVGLGSKSIPLLCSVRLKPVLFVLTRTTTTTVLHRFLFCKRGSLPLRLR